MRGFGQKDASWLKVGHVSNSGWYDSLRSSYCSVPGNLEQSWASAKDAGEAVMVMASEMLIFDSMSPTMPSGRPKAS